MENNYWSYFEEIVMNNPPIDEERENNRLLEIEKDKAKEVPPLDISIALDREWAEYFEERNINEEIERIKEILNGSETI